MDITGITEEYVQRSAVNASALANARKISSKNEFTGRTITQDKSLIYGDCKGSGKEPYHTSVDVSSNEPICRCSCPSRQIPCKHALALMLDFVSGKEFVQGEVPEDVARKREKIAKRAQKAPSDETEEIVDEKAAAKKKAAFQAAAKKKALRQLEGLALVSDFVRETLHAGVGTVNSTKVAGYRDLVKQLGDYYLSGPQRLLQDFVLAASADGDGVSERELVRRLIRLDQTAGKLKIWLEKQIESGQYGPQDDVLFEELGGIWKLDQLDALGLYEENVRLCQLSFQVLWDAPTQAEIDTGYWVNLESGEISKTENIRPVKAKKYVHADDSAFEVYTVKKLYRYPGGINRRIRWDDAKSGQRDCEIPAKIVSLARCGFAPAVKEAKNELKNTLSDPSVAMLLSFDRIDFMDGQAVLRLGEETLLLKENADYAGTIAVLRLLPEKYLENGAMLGEFWYSPEDKALYLAPVTVVTKRDILRLL